jgi:3-oxoadipate enol-lactonase
MTSSEQTINVVRKSGTCPVRQGALHYVEAGDGFPVLLIHGLAGDHSAWDRQIDELSQSWRVIAPDNRGAGRSSLCEGPESIASLADDVLRLLDELKIERCHVVGRALGGMVGQELALKRPTVVQSLVLIASAAKVDGLGARCLENMLDVVEWRRSWPDYARHAIQYFLGDRFYDAAPEAVAALLTRLSHERDLDSYRHSNVAVRSHDLLQSLHTITCPVLVMSGDRDPICSPTATQWMLDRLPHASSEVFSGCSHFFLFEDAPRFNLLLAEWLRKHTDNGALHAA